MGNLHWSTFKTRRIKSEKKPVLIVSNSCLTWQIREVIKDLIYCVLQLSFLPQIPLHAIIKNATSKIEETGVMLGATVPMGCGTAWILGRKNHPFMELVTKRLLTEYRWLEKKEICIF